VLQVMAEHGGVDFLINNAGRSIRRAIESSYDRLHDYERTMQLNYFGSLRVTTGFCRVWSPNARAMWSTSAALGC
jgi:NAD(P)-dependent dehydrogenase (short-subunit alcohol dehydrogenase family)